ncbi:MAG: bifunctional 3,4-dihydroxy-2-butanone-4-phosphate synthase/GTP cyclohydrolase II [Planctomycetes bacterium]|nr:bifunctional 3,4-dihydroxy-2-butanone-4-phosphate synthase/GTP cyclohydrolase II [Planctomycetota bacterium]
MTFATIPEILEDMRNGKMIVLVDDEDRENEGDLCVAAEAATPEVINFMATYAKGLICLAMDKAMVDRLELNQQAENNDSKFGTAFTVSVDARYGITTGISAFDRARTIQVAIAENARPSDLVRPGHIFPLRAVPGGTLKRAGQTEGITDLARLAGMKPAGVICEIMNEDGSMSRLPQLEEFIKKYDLKMCAVAELIQYRRRHERLIERVVKVNLPTRYGEFELHVYHSKVDSYQHLALCKNIPERTGSQPRLKDPILVRVHSECLTGDLFGSNLCDCGTQLDLALRKIAEHGMGILLYMRQEGRGIGLENKLKAYHLQQNKGLDTIEANQALGFADDVRDYGIGAQILADLGVKRMELLTNNPRKFHALDGYGLEIVKRVPIIVPPTERNAAYLRTKKEKMGHLLDEIEEELDKKPVTKNDKKSG